MQLALMPLELALVVQVPVLQVLAFPVPLQERVLLTLQVMLQVQARLVQAFWAAWSLSLLGPKLFATNQEAGNHLKASLKWLPHPV